MESSERMERFKIGGMHGPDCAAAVEHIVSQVSGVSAVHVDAEAAMLTVHADGDFSPRDIQKQLAGAGYHAVPEAEVVGPGDSALDREDPRANLRMIVACGVAGVVVVLLQRGGEAARLAILLVATAAIVIAGASFFRGAIAAERNHTANMDTLITLGIGVACLYSIFTMFPRIFFSGTQFFDTAICLILFVRFGKFVESRGRRFAMSLLRAPLAGVPAEGVVIRDGKEAVLPISELEDTDTIVVAQGARIPADGVLIEGTGSVDESVLTGDEAPVEKVAGSPLFCGTVNLSAPIKIRAHAAGQETAIARAVRAAEEGLSGKPVIQKKADGAAARIAQIAVGASALTFAAWLWLGGGGQLAVSAAIAVLVSSAPAAMGQVAAVALVVGTVVGLRRGMLFKRAAVLEAITHANVVIFAKSGILTVGRPELDTLVALDGSAGEALSTAAIAAAGSSHPLARAIMEGARAQGAAPAQSPSEVREVAGMGLVASHGGRRIALGNEHLMTRFGVPIEPADRDELDQIAGSGATPAFLALDRKIIAVMGFRDPVKPEARGALAVLRAQGVKLVLASGDHAAVANELARRLGIDEVHAQLMAAGKIGVVKHFQKEGKLVCMVGNGTLDAPALAAADIGIAIGAGADLAAESADVVLARNDLCDVVRAFALARATFAKIQQNLILARVYNLFAIPIAAGALYPLVKIALSPAVGGLAMGLAGAGVVHNALLLNVGAWLKLRAIQPEIEQAPQSSDAAPVAPGSDGSVGAQKPGDNRSAVTAGPLSSAKPN